MCLLSQVARQLRKRTLAQRDICEKKYFSNFANIYFTQMSRCASVSLRKCLVAQLSSYASVVQPN
jgi:hypothetical protein